MQQEINKITSSIIPEFSSGSSTHAVAHETTKRQALKTLKPISNETPYKDTTGRGPAVKAAVQDDSLYLITAFMKDDSNNKKTPRGKPGGFDKIILFYF